MKKGFLLKSSLFLVDFSGYVMFPAGSVGPWRHHSAAHIHPTPDEEAAKAWKDTRGGGGGVGGGHLRRAGSDAVEVLRRRAAGGAVRSPVGRQGRPPERGEDPQLLDSAAVSQSGLDVLQRGGEAAEGPPAEELASNAR